MTIPPNKPDFTSIASFYGFPAGATSEKENTNEKVMRFKKKHFLINLLAFIKAESHRPAEQVLCELQANLERSIYELEREG